MKHIKPINEFFGPFKKKSEDDKIALDFLKRIKKINPENNPYDIKKLSNNEMRDLQGNGVKILLPYHVYIITFDDVDLIICGYEDVHYGASFHGELYIKSHDEGIIDEVKCDLDIRWEIYSVLEKIYKNDDGKSKERLARIKRNINPAADLLESTKSTKSMADKLGLLQDLSVDLSDEGLYVKVTMDDPRFKRKTGEQYVYLRIDDNDKVFCKNYPKDDMDWLSTKPIIEDFIKNLEGFGMHRDKDYKVYAGGTSVTLIFSGKGVDSIKLWKYIV